LVTLFPEYKLGDDVLKRNAGGYWKDINNQKKFFDDLAGKLSILLSVIPTMDR
jgi:hypothetical protein